MAHIKSDSIQSTGHDNGLMQRLVKLPHKILKNHDVDGLSEMVLHELGHDNCFGFKRAIYLVDNPDFNHLAGMAGYCRDECKYHKEDVWKDPYCFHQDMREAAFHKKIRELLKYSVVSNDINIHDSHDIQALAKEAGMHNSQFISWNLKHGNHGVLIVEKGKTLSDWQTDLLENVAAYLGLCRS